MIYISLEHGAGDFFSLFSSVLNHLSWCEKHKKTPVVFLDKRSYYYDPVGLMVNVIIHGNTILNLFQELI